MVKKKVKGIAVFGEGFVLQQLRNPRRFKKLSDGWIKDNFLGLEWGPSSTSRMTWEAAKKYCKDQGGRLPEIDEIITLQDRSRSNPAIDPIFKDAKTDDYYWSNTPVAGLPGHAWCVYFFGGRVSGWGKDHGNYVRPVRSSQN